MPKSEICTIPGCGKPRVEGATLARCQEHTREYWRNRKAHERQASEPVQSKRRKASSAPASAAEPPSAIIVQPVSGPPVRKLSVRVSGDQVTMDMPTFHRLMRYAVPIATDQTPNRQFAVVSGDLSRVLLCEATPRETHGLDEDHYAHQLQQLRDAGWTVCVEG